MAMGTIRMGFAYLNSYPTGQINTHTPPHTRPRVGDRSHTHIRMGKWVPASFPYPHILLKGVNIFSISTKIIISNSTQEQYL
jgi:hypothetical protein